MEVTMLETRRVCEDGRSLRLCEAGQTYDLADTAARMLINEGYAFEPRCRAKEPWEIMAATLDLIYKAFEPRPFAQNPQTHEDLNKPL